MRKRCQPDASRRIVTTTPARPSRSTWWSSRSSTATLRVLLDPPQARPVRRALGDPRRVPRDRRADRGRRPARAPRGDRARRGRGRSTLIGVFGDPGRDPRGRTISLAHATAVREPRARGRRAATTPRRPPGSTPARRSGWPSTTTRSWRPPSTGSGAASTDGSLGLALLPVEFGDDDVGALTAPSAADPARDPLATSHGAAKGASIRKPGSDGRFRSVARRAEWLKSSWGLSREVGLAEDLEAHRVQGGAGLLDVVDVHGHGAAAVGVDDQRIGVMDVDLGLEQRRAEVHQRLRAGRQLGRQQLILGERQLVQLRGSRGPARDG